MEIYLGPRLEFSTHITYLCGTYNVNRRFLYISKWCSIKLCFVPLFEKWLCHQYRLVLVILDVLRSGFRPLPRNLPFLAVGLVVFPRRFLPDALELVLMYNSLITSLYLSLFTRLHIYKHFDQWIRKRVVTIVNIWSINFLLWDL